LLRRAIDCFDRQTVASREMVIVAEDDDAETLQVLRELESRKDIVPVIVSRQPKKPLGDLRGISVARARGEFVVQWDDDDFFHPDRLAAQLAEIRRTGRRACVLRRWIIYKDGRAVVSSARHWEGSLMCRKADMPAYPSLHRGEDTPVIEQLEAANKLVALDRPDLYVYAFHGGNTWHSLHWEGAFSAGAAPASAAEFPILQDLRDYEQRTRSLINIAAAAGV
jgi:glycosyltransferase involved in cell wall biosynthesis